MGQIVFWARQRHFGIARHLDFPWLITAIDDRQAAHFHVVLGRDGDLELRFEAAVTTAIGDLVEVKRRFELFRLLAHRLKRRRPDSTRPGIAQIDVVRRSCRRSGHPAGG